MPNATTETTRPPVLATQKPTQSKFRSILTFLYNPADGTVMGRTGLSWFQVTLFYLLFWAVLAAFFAVLLVIFVQTLDPKEPKWQQDDGIIGSFPGMSFRPVLKDWSNPNSHFRSFLWVKQNATPPNIDDTNRTPGPVQAYIDELGNFLRPYEWAENHKKCSDADIGIRNDSASCGFDLDQLGPCVKGQNFGYSQGRPCVLIKLNRLFGWVPDTYDSVDEMTNPELVDFITRVQQQTVESVFKANQVFVSCHGKDDMDKEHIGPVALYPATFPKYYFPYRNTPGYVSPVVMVQFLNPNPGVVIFVECKAWARNIQHIPTGTMQGSPLGTVMFEIMVDWF